MYSPGWAQISTTLPWSTIIMHCPSLTAMTEPLEITLSLPFLLEPLLEVFLLPFTARILAGMESQ